MGRGMCYNPEVLGFRSGTKKLTLFVFLPPRVRIWCLFQQLWGVCVVTRIWAVWTPEFLPFAARAVLSREVNFWISCACSAFSLKDSCSSSFLIISMERGLSSFQFSFWVLRTFLQLSSVENGQKINLSARFLPLSISQTSLALRLPRAEVLVEDFGTFSKNFGS